MDIVRQLVESRPDFFQNRIANQDRVVKINDFISMSIGLSNAYMVATPAGRVIINTGMGFEALTHKKVFDAECPGPTPYIVLTQGHVDHVGGVSLFREEGTQLIAQRNLAGSLTLFGDLYAKAGRASDASLWYTIGSTDWAGWPFRAIGEDRMANLATRIQLYQDADPANDPPIVGSGPEACAYCHYK